MIIHISRAMALVLAILTIACGSKVAPCTSVSPSCPGVQRCNPIAGKCQAAGIACSTNGDCAVGEQCTAKLCAPATACTSAGCGAGSVCNSLRKSCQQASAPCTSGNDCGDSEHCDVLNSKCAATITISLSTVSGDAPDGRIATGLVLGGTGFGSNPTVTIAGPSGTRRAMSVTLATDTSITAIFGREPEIGATTVMVANASGSASLVVDLELGETGPIGPAGAPGSDGAAGATGPAGLAGSIGAIGATGPMGAAGPAGAPGETGPTGPQGAAGVTGPAAVADDGTTLLAKLQSARQDGGLIAADSLGGIDAGQLLLADGGASPLRAGAIGQTTVADGTYVYSAQFRIPTFASLGSILVPVSGEGAILQPAGALPMSGQTWFYYLGAGLRLATSTDGITFARAQSGAVLPGTSTWYAAAIVKDGAGLVHAFWTPPNSGSGYQLFHSTSPDGITFTQQGTGPVVAAAYPRVLYENGRFRLWYGEPVKYRDSADGSAWTAEEPQIAQQSWYRFETQQFGWYPSVVKLGSTYLMASGAEGTPYGAATRGWYMELFTSFDGHVWSRMSGGPVLFPTARNDGSGAANGLLYASGTWLSLFTTNTGNGAISLAVSPL